MRIAFFVGARVDLSTRLKNSGTWVLTLISAVEKYLPEIEIFILCTDPTIKLIESKKYGNIEVYYLPTFKGNKVKKYLYFKGYYDPFKNLASNTNVVLEKINPDILHVFGFEGPFIRLLNSSKIPIVVDFQGYFHAYRFKTNHSRIKTFHNKIITTVFRNAGIIRQKQSDQRMENILSYEQSIQYSKLIHFLGRTEWDYFLAKALSPSVNYYYCQRILRQEFSENEWKPTKSDVFRIFTTTKDALYKNIDIIFESVNLLNRFNPDFKLKWTLAGVDHRSKIPKILMKKFPMINNVILVGRLDSTEIVEQMLHSDLFVLPSAIENSPNALQEAMLIGMPVIATHSGGTSVFIEHNQDGILIPEGEPYSLAGAITELSQNYSKAIEFGKKARERALSRNNPEVIAKQLIIAYKNIMKSSNNKNINTN